MQKDTSYPYLALTIILLVNVLLVSTLFLHIVIPPGKPEVLKQYDEVNRFFLNVDNTEKIKAFIQDDLPRSRFREVFIDKLVENEQEYAEIFEELYPRYKKYNEVKRELSREDYSEWIADVINGNIETEYQNDVYNKLIDLNNDFYIKQAVSQFLKTTDTIEKSKDASDTAKLLVLLNYIEKFPENNEFRQAIGRYSEKIRRLAYNGETLTGSNIYFYIYAKYFSKNEEFIDQKLAVFRSKEKTLNSRTNYFDQKDIDALIHEFAFQYSGISSYCYPLFSRCFGRDEYRAVYAFIALRVFSEIGYNDPQLNTFLNNREYSGLGLIRYNTLSDLRAYYNSIENGMEEARTAIARFRRQRENAVRGGASTADLRKIDEEIQKAQAKLTAPATSKKIIVGYWSNIKTGEFNLSDEARTVNQLIKNKLPPDTIYHNLASRTKNNLVPTNPVRLKDEINKEFALFDSSEILKDMQYSKSYIQDTKYKYIAVQEKLKKKTVFFMIVVLAVSTAFAISTANKLETNKGKYLFSWIPVFVIGHIVLLIGRSGLSEEMTYSILMFLFGGSTVIMLIMYLSSHKINIKTTKIFLNLCASLCRKMNCKEAGRYYYDMAEKNIFFDCSAKTTHPRTYCAGGPWGVKGLYDFQIKANKQLMELNQETFQKYKISVDENGYYHIMAEANNENSFNTEAQNKKGIKKHFLIILTIISILIFIKLSYIAGKFNDESIKKQMIERVKISIENKEIEKIIKIKEAVTEIRDEGEISINIIYDNDSAAKIDKLKEALTTFFAKRNIMAIISEQDKNFIDENNSYISIAIAIKYQYAEYVLNHKGINGNIFNTKHRLISSSIMDSYINFAKGEEIYSAISNTVYSGSYTKFYTERYGIDNYKREIGLDRHESDSEHNEYLKKVYFNDLQKEIQWEQYVDELSIYFD